MSLSRQFTDLYKLENYKMLNLKYFKLMRDSWLKTLNSIGSHQVAQRIIKISDTQFQTDVSSSTLTFIAWLECMIDYTEGVLKAVKTLKLETLIIDLDMFKDSPVLIHSIITEVSTLKRIVRLERVDYRFWRLLSKFSCIKIKS